MTVYLDLLFIRNFLSDFALLAVASFLCRQTFSWGKVCGISFLGAAAAVIPIAACGKIQGNLIQNMLSGFVLCILFFGLRRGVTRFTALFFLLSCLFSGAATLFRNFLLPENLFVSLLLFSLFLLCLSTALLFVFCFDGTGGNIFQARIKLRQRSAAFPAYRDTGNTLVEPITGRHVLVCDYRSLSALFSEAFITEWSRKKNCGERFTELCRAYPEVAWLMIPVHTVTGSEMMIGFLPDEVVIGGKRKENIAVALTDQLDGEQAEFSALAGDWR